MTRFRIAVGATLLAGGASIALFAGAVGARTSAKGKHDTATGYVSVNRSAGGFTYASGIIYDKLLGADAVALKLTLKHVSGGTFKATSSNTVLYTGTGSLKGSSSATVTISGSTQTFSNGKINLTKGAGSQKGHSLVGTYSGSGSITKNQSTLKFSGTYK